MRSSRLNIKFILNLLLLIVLTILLLLVLFEYMMYSIVRNLALYYLYCKSQLFRYINYLPSINCKNFNEK